MIPIKGVKKAGNARDYDEQQVAMRSQMYGTSDSAHARQSSWTENVISSSTCCVMCTVLNWGVSQHKVGVATEWGQL